MSRHFLITGGNSGIGAATAIRLCESNEAKSIALVARNEERLKKTAELCKAKNDKVNIFTFSGDLTDDTTCEKVVNEAAKAMNGIDVLVSNAGAATVFGTVEEMSVADFRHGLNVNLTSHFAMVKTALPHLKKSTSANIVFVSSVAATKPIKCISSYAAAKAGLDMLTKILALENVNHKIRVNSISPGPVDTPGFDTAYGDKADAARKACLPQIPIGRMGSSEEIARLIEFTASEVNYNMTGSILITDGGYSILD